MTRKNILSSRPQNLIRLHESLLTVSEAARWLQVHEKTLYRWIAQGRVPHVRVGGRAVRLRLADLQEAIKCHGLKESS